MVFPDLSAISRKASPIGTNYMRVPRLIKNVALAVLRKVSVTLPATVGGRRFAIPIVEATGLGHLRPFEPELLAALQELLPPRGGAFVDVGANIGQTLLKVKSIDPARRYVGIEPNPSCFAYLQRLIDDNRFPASTCMPVALGQVNGIVELHLNSSIDACASTTPGIRRPNYYRHSVSVIQQTGDSLVGGLALDSVAMLKIDVEGAELDVLLGFAATIEKFRPVICVEVLPPLANVGEETNGARLRLATGICEWAMAQRYAIRSISKDGTLASVGPLVPHPEKTTNYILTPAA